MTCCTGLQSGGKASGTWPELFGWEGGGFMTAWSIASYIDGVVAVAGELRLIKHQSYQCLANGTRLVADSGELIHRAARSSKYWTFTNGVHPMWT